jgi:hypothetical protein
MLDMILRKGMMENGRKEKYRKGKMSKIQISKTKIIEMYMDRNAENESILKYKSPSLLPSISHVHLHVIFLFSTFLFSIFFPFDIFPFCLFPSIRSKDYSPTHFPVHQSDIVLRELRFDCLRD